MILNGFNWLDQLLVCEVATKSRLKVSNAFSIIFLPMDVLVRTSQKLILMLGICGRTLYMYLENTM